MNPEQHRVRHTDEGKPGSDDDSKQNVEQGLRQEVPAQTVCAVVDRLGGAMQIVRSGEPDQAIYKILPLQQEKDHEDGDETRRGEGVD